MSFCEDVADQVDPTRSLLVLRHSSVRAMLDAGLGCLSGLWHPRRCCSKAGLAGQGRGDEFWPRRSRWLQPHLPHSPWH